jgi:DNA-binding transcriptional MocR family regulator
MNVASYRRRFSARSSQLERGCSTYNPRTPIPQACALRASAAPTSLGLRRVQEGVFLRLSYGSAEADALRRGVQKLGRVLRAMAGH